MNERIKALKSAISFIKKEKALLNKRIGELDSDLRNKEHELNELKLKNRRVPKAKVLEAYLLEETSTVGLMDEFEEYENGKPKYLRIIIMDLAVRVEGIAYRLVLERLEGRRYEGDLTMTDLKLRNYKTSGFGRYAKDEINKGLSKKEIRDGEVFFFTRPYRLRAQNSTNRTGYGSEFIGGAVYQGTLYGETTDYGLVGVIR